MVTIQQGLGGLWHSGLIADSHSPASSLSGKASVAQELLVIAGIT